MIVDLFEYEILLVDENDYATPRGRGPARPDWIPAVEWCLLQGVRQSLLPGGRFIGDARVEPVWHAKAGRPYVGGFRVSVTPSTGKCVSVSFPISYFSARARELQTELVAAGNRELGTECLFRVVAEPRNAPPKRTLAMKLEADDPPLTFPSGSLTPLLEKALRFGDGLPGDVPVVFVHWPVMQAATALTRAAAPNETGGVLVGRVLHDPVLGEVFVEVTGLIPVATTTPDLTRFTFSGEAWTFARNALAKGPKEVGMVGWFHSHAYFHSTCKACPGGRNEDCLASQAFFSPEDGHVHRTMFPRAFSVALLCTDAPCTGLSWSFFGWRNGVVTARAFHVLGAPMPEQALTPTRAPIKGVLAHARP